MSDLSFLVRGRSMDLVAMTARTALRSTLGLGDEIVELGRDDVVVVHDIEDAAGGDWTSAVGSHQHWFNPNKHRFAAFLSDGAAFEAIEGRGEWPSPWLSSLVDTDRPDLVAARDAGGIPDLLSAWMAPPAVSGAFAVGFVAYDLEDGVSRLPLGHWPDPGLKIATGVLWTLTLRAPDADRARARAEEILVTRTRTQGMLVHPHMEGWRAVGTPRPCDPVPEVPA
jgi:hypothetical protein